MAIDSLHHVSQKEKSSYDLKNTDAYIQGFRDQLIKPETLTSFHETNEAISKIVEDHLNWMERQKNYDRDLLAFKQKAVVLLTVSLLGIGAGLATLGTLANVCIIIVAIAINYFHFHTFLPYSYTDPYPYYDCPLPGSDKNLIELCADDDSKKNNEKILAITEVIRKLQTEVTYLTSSLSSSLIGKEPIREELQIRLCAMKAMKASQTKMLEVFNFIVSCNKKPNTH